MPDPIVRTPPASTNVSPNVPQAQGSPPLHTSILSSLYQIPGFTYTVAGLIYPVIDPRPPIIRGALALAGGYYIGEKYFDWGHPVLSALLGLVVVSTVKGYTVRDEMGLQDA